MGNKMCKRKVDNVDGCAPQKKSSLTSFNKIFNRLHLRPGTWKSESYLNEKQAKRSDANPTDRPPNDVVKTQHLSKSSDWTEMELEVPRKDDEEHLHLRNPKLSLIFNNEENGVAPTPPPRKHKKNFREKIEAVAKSGLQAFQGGNNNNKKPVEETVCVKKKINYKCPVCDEDETSHNRNHHHHNHKNGMAKRKESSVKDPKEVRDDGFNNNINKAKRNKKKNISVVSLPNYDELKLTVVNFDTDKSKNTSNLQDVKKPNSGRPNNNITRWRSFGSLLPHHVKKLKLPAAPTDIESDDSFGGLEDWDLGLIEHYNPKDASLPRPRKNQRTSQEIISDLESLIVQDEESPIKKSNKPPVEATFNKHFTPPSSPMRKEFFVSNLPTKEDGKVEHSSLMRILEEFSIRDKQEQQQGNESSSLQELEKNVTSVQDFIQAEKVNTDRDLESIKTTGVVVAS